MDISLLKIFKDKIACGLRRAFADENHKLEPCQEITSIIDESIIMKEPNYYDGSWWDGLEGHDGDVYARYEVKPIIEILQRRIKYLEEENAKLRGD